MKEAKGVGISVGGLQYSGKIALLVIALVVGQFLLATMINQTIKSKLRSAEIEKESIKKEFDKPETKEALKNVEEVQAAVKSYEKIVKSQFDYSELWTSLEKEIIDNVWIESLVIDGKGKMTVILGSNSYLDMAKQVKTLSTSRYFSKLLLGSIEKTEGKVRFTLDGEYTPVAKQNESTLANPSSQSAPATASDPSVGDSPTEMPTAPSSP